MRAWVLPSDPGQEGSPVTAGPCSRWFQGRLQCGSLHWTWAQDTWLVVGRELCTGATRCGFRHAPPGTPSALLTSLPWGPEEEKRLASLPVPSRVGTGVGATLHPHLLMYWLGKATPTPTSFVPPQWVHPEAVVSDILPVEVSLSTPSAYCQGAEPPLLRTWRMRSPPTHSLGGLPRTWWNSHNNNWFCRWRQQPNENSWEKWRAFYRSLLRSWWKTVMLKQSIRWCPVQS